jgi:hypothetical protein
MKEKTFTAVNSGFPPAFLQEKAGAPVGHPCLNAHILHTASNGVNVFFSDLNSLLFCLDGPSFLIKETERNNFHRMKEN